MDAYVIDWATVWDVIKTVAQAGLAIWGVRYAVTSFRAQKGIEFRVDWYKRTHFEIGKTAELVLEATRRQVLEAEANRVAAAQACDRLIATLDEGFLHAGQEGFNATRQFASNLIDVAVTLHNNQQSVPMAKVFALQCAAVAEALTNEYRKELQLGAVQMPPISESETAKLLRTDGLSLD